MKGISILFTVSLFVFAAFLAQRLRQSGVLPGQITGRETRQSKSVPVEFVNYSSNNPHHLN